MKKQNSSISFSVIKLKLFIVCLLMFTGFSACDDNNNDIGNDHDIDESEFVGMETIFAEETHELEHIDPAAPGTAVVWIDGDVYEFKDYPNCRYTGSSITAGAETDPEDAVNFWVYIHRLIQGGDFEAGDDYRFEREETTVEIAYGDNHNERGWLIWDQMDDENPDWQAGSGNPPTIRATEDGDITIKGEFSGHDLFTGEVEISMTCEDGWEER